MEILDKDFEDRLAKLSLTNDGKDYRKLGALDKGAASQVCDSLIFVQLQDTLGLHCQNAHCANASHRRCGNMHELRVPEGLSYS